MIPDFQTAMLPLLKKLEDEKIYDSEMLRKTVVDHFKITNDEKNIRTPNGKQLLYYNRIAWSISYLKTGGLIQSPERGKYKITDLGKKILKNPPDKITKKFLEELSSNKDLFGHNKKNSVVKKN